MAKRRFGRILGLVAIAVLLSGCVVFPGRWFIVNVRHVEPDAYALWGNLTWSGGSGAIVWDGSASPEDNAPAATVTGPHEVFVGSNLQANTGDDHGYLPEPDVFLARALDEAIHLNVSSPIIVDLFLKDNGAHPGKTVTDVTSAESFYPYYYYHWDSRCGIALDLELRVGDLIIAGATAGQYLDPYDLYGTYQHPTPPPGYMLCTYRMAPEVLTLEAGTVLSLHVIHVHEDQPVQYGLADDHRSRIIIPTYSAEEWLFRNPDQKAQEPGTFIEDPGGAAFAGAAAFFGLALHGRRRWSVPITLLLCLSAAGLAGCVSSKSDAPPESSDANRGLLDQNLIAGAGNGTIVGLVHDDLHVPIGGVHVSVLNTAAFTTTDGRGRFTIAGLPTGHFVLRFDHKLYRSFESPPVAVKEGFTNRIDVTLYLVNQADIDARPHSHDYWGDLPKIPIFEGDIIPVCDPDVAAVNAALLENGCWPKWEWMPLPTQQRPVNTILPGTYDVEIVLDWDTEETDLPMLGLLVQHAGDSAYNRSQYVPRAPGTPFHIRTSWEMADTGHQTLSSWRFSAYASPRHYPGALESYQQNLWSLSSSPKLHAKIVIHKGVIPLEPAHPDHWAGKDEYDAGKYTLYTYSCIDTGSSDEKGSCAWTFGPGSKRIIPPGTKRVEVTVKGSIAPELYDLNFAYRGADKPYIHGYWDDYKTVTASRSGATYTFKIDIKESEADHEYAKVSNFGFLVWPNDWNMFFAEYYAKDWNILTITMKAYRT